MLFTTLIANFKKKHVGELQGVINLLNCFII